MGNRVVANHSGSPSYEITFDNYFNQSLDVEDVTITDNMPFELDFVSTTNDGVYDSNTHTVTWNIGTIHAGEAGPVIELEVQVNSNATPGSTILNYCTIEGNNIPPTTVIDQDPDDPNDDPRVEILENQPPVADLTGPYLSTLDICFDGTGSSDPYGDPLTFEWDFGGGITGYGATPCRTYI